MKTTVVRAAALACLLPLCALADHDEIPFDVAEIFFELNNTDGDLGIHALIDGEPWKRLAIEDLDERRMLNISVRSRLRRVGAELETRCYFACRESLDVLPFERVAVVGWQAVERDLDQPQ